jgi:mannitol/fructose-specific phosphotransferase system IIA component (Ntr-type)
MRSILTALQEGRLFELPDTGGKVRALEFLARILDANPDIEVGTDTIEEIQLREQECNTGIGMGVGVPHVRARRDEGELFSAIGWSSQGIDYDASDGKPVHLVVMYYIPGAQKNVYLKEVSSLVKAIRKSGGMDPIADAPDLNAVRNLLLDWVSAGLGNAAPEAVARMIRLEVKQAQTQPVPAAPVPVELPVVTGRSPSRVLSFTVLVTPPGLATVLAHDPDWMAMLEKESGLAQRLAAGAPFAVAGYQLLVISTTAYSGDRVLYQCVAVMGGS